MVAEGATLMRVVICGGGVLGACLAYFSSLRRVEVTVIERTGVACAASGKSGGFLALDWCDGSPLGPLARRSFALHAELAARFGDVWGYRRLATSSVLASARRALGRQGRAHQPSWLGEHALLHRQLGTAATTAQVHPGLFTKAMMRAAVDHGARLRVGRVVGIRRAPDGLAATGVILDGGEVIAADAVVIAMGPWSILACQWLPLPPVHGLKGNSILLESGSAAQPHALFVELEDAAGAVHAPEVFPRPDGTTYVCGLSSESPLPVDPGQVVPDPGAPETLRAMTRLFAPALASRPILAAQACYRPVTRDGLPLLGPVLGVANAYVATGHSVWGILNAPASGEAMAELIVEGDARTVDLALFDPGRLLPASMVRR
jgi:glycine/D-amino acid oxidase-like deaminating enzyme